MPQSEKAKSMESPESARRSSRGTPLVFISHDSRDAVLAEAFSKLLGSVSAGVLKSFRSSDRKGSQGIEYGVEWYPELMKKLELASDVVCLLTKRSLDRPWILYEAGVAKGKLDTPVYGVALGIPLNKANTGPFAQFQNCDDKEESLTKLVHQLLRRVPDSEPEPDAIQMQVKVFKQRGDALLKEIEGSAKPEEPEPHTEGSSTAKLFEEIKVMFQDLPSRIEGRLTEAVGPMRRPPLRRVHPMMIQDMMHVVPDDPSDPLALVLVAGLLRDDFPWLHEVIMEAYRDAKRGGPANARKAIHRLRQELKFITRGPWLEAYVVSRETQMLATDVPRLLDEYLRRLEAHVRSGAGGDRAPEGGETEG